MRVHMLISMASSEFSVAPGDAHECDEAEAARLFAAGYAIPIIEPATDPDAPVPALADIQSLRPEWVPVFEAEGFATVAAIAAATVEQLDALPVDGLGPKTAVKIIAEAQALLATES